MTCTTCGGDMIGDGYTLVRHCENVEDIEGLEPDANPVYCVAPVPFLLAVVGPEGLKKLGFVRQHVVDLADGALAEFSVTIAYMANTDTGRTVSVFARSVGADHRVYTDARKLIREADGVLAFAYDIDNSEEAELVAQVRKLGKSARLIQI